MSTPGPIAIYRTACGECGRNLEGNDPALVCSYADTFCAPCARRFHWRCPSCDGELTRRPRRGYTEPVRARGPDRPLGNDAHLRIVRATSKDIDPAARLFDAYRQFYGERTDLAAARRFLRERLSAGESIVFLARQDGETVGFAQLYPTFSSTRLGPVWILNDLFVTPGARRHGIGSRLLEECERLVKRTRARGEWLETAIDNPAQRLYAGRGWTLDREFLHFDWTRTAPRSLQASKRPRRRRDRSSSRVQATRSGS